MFVLKFLHSLHRLPEVRVRRRDSLVALRQRRRQAPSKTTLGQEGAVDWLTAAQVGAVRTRSGGPYKASALRSYRQVLYATVLPALGRQKLLAISQTMLEELIDDPLAADALSGCGRSLVGSRRR